MDSRWHEAFYDNVQSDLTRFSNLTIVNDRDIRNLLREHIAQILQHYRDDTKAAIGKLADYLEALELSNQLADKMSATFWGYTSLIPTATKYIASKLVGHKYYFSGDLRKIATLAKRGSVIENGNKIFPQVTCGAEAEFGWLILQYLDYFLKSGQFHGKFTQHSVNTVLMMPGLLRVVEKREKKIRGRIEKFEGSKIEDEELRLELR